MKSIGTKLFLIIALFTLVCSAFLLQRTHSLAKRFIDDSVHQQAALALQFNLSIRRYVDEKIRPVMYQLVGREEFIPETMSTSYVSRSIFADVNYHFPELILKFSAEDPRNPLNRATPEELAIIDYFNLNPGAESWQGTVRLNDTQYLAHFKPRRTEEDCLKCHGAPADAPPSLVARYGMETGFNWPLGQVVATDTVGIPIDEIRAKMWAAIIGDLVIIAVSLFLLLGAVFVLVRKLIGSRLAIISANFEKVCRQKDDSVQLPTLADAGNDEIGSLAQSYNQLAAKLHRYHDSMQEQLQQRTAMTEQLRREISERMAAEKEKQEMERKILHVQKLESLGVLAGGIAHDFNNLLVPIVGNAELAKQELPQNAPAQKQLADIIKASQRAGELCRQMLACSGKGQLVSQQLDLSEVTRELAEMLAVSVDKKAKINYQLASSPLPVTGDATQIRQVIMNLITNASEALEGCEGEVTVRTGSVTCDREYFRQNFNEELPPGQYAFLEVEDNGCGMDAETAARIFDPFFTTKFTGRGLGLAAVLGIIRGHHGAIRVYSEPGRGTVMKVLFPIAKDAEQASSAVTAETRIDPDWRGSGTILLVDDEEMVRDTGAAILRAKGFDVLTAGDGREAVDIFKQQPGRIDCVVLDMNMPVMDGAEAFQELRKIQPDIPVLLASGYSAQEIVQRFHGGELAGFIQKPYQIDKLLEELQKIMPPTKSTNEIKK
ncbi:c-type heme family protein [Desulfurivibrio dismutans]|uniref:c-type heme family protein n=1 Tax=Desulfurivibrio dismutans TaxID=1398908 RepID=UPI0023D9DCD8|nr:DUF3365 domain-containing protein [Desulfurivibrio alkaliphilus]MDF1615515.1 DUF3365 domain-containing protein [Desulfurivibrio alkaliphilus]